MRNEDEPPPHEQTLTGTESSGYDSALITPTYRRDPALFADLHQSVLLHTDESVKHYVVVPSGDADLFSAMAGPRCIIVPEESLYSANYKSVSIVNQILRPLSRVLPHARIAAINTKRPFRPIRGWVMQQVLKMELSRQLNVQTWCCCSTLTWNSCGR